MGHAPAWESRVCGLGNQSTIYTSGALERKLEVCRGIGWSFQRTDFVMKASTTERLFLRHAEAVSSLPGCFIMLRLFHDCQLFHNA